MTSIQADDAVLGETINLGCGDGRSIRQVVEVVEDTLGRKLEIETDASRIRPEKSEVERLWASNQKLFEITGWRPEYSIDQGLAETINWMQDNLSKYKTNIYNL